MKQRLERIGLEAAMVLATLIIWTGAPLLAMWVGSQATSTTQVTMGAVLLVVVTLFGTCLALIWALSWASTRHDRLTGRTQAVRRHVPWLRSMRAERVDYERSKSSVTFLDRLIVIMVVLAVIAFEAWFFIADPSPIAPGPSKD